MWIDNDSNKGFVYTKIEKNGKNVHVIGTHTQSEDSRCGAGHDRKIRAEQMKEISDFVKKKNIPKDETVYIGGDLNVNKGTEEFKDMLKNLNVMMFYMQVIIAHGTLNQIQLRNIIILMVNQNI